MTEKSMIHLHSGSGRTRVELLCLSAGSGYIIYLYGGEEHIGAVGVGQCYDRSTDGANSSVIAISGHREDDLVKEISRSLAKELKSTVVVIAGIHYDQLDKNELQKILAHATALSRLLLRQILNH